MLNSLFLLGFRNLRKRKVFSFLNIFGLAIGIAACLVIVTYVDFEASYDNFHLHGSRLFRVTRATTHNGEKLPPIIVTTYGLGPALAAELPEVKRAVRLHPMYGGAVMTYESPSGESRAFHEKKITMADSTFLRAFTFRALAGIPETALDQPRNIVITKAVALKYFGQDDPIGKTLKLSGGWEDGDYQVAAVIENVPGNSHFDFEILVPTHNLFSREQYQRDDGWAWNNFITYVELNEGATRETAMRKLPEFARRHIDARHKDAGYSTSLDLQPVTQIHLQPGYRHDGDTISRSTLYFFALIAVFILFIAWINYINLSTARALERAHEVGIKKTIGAHRGQLIGQFFLESALINFLGIALALGLAVMLLPALAGIIGKPLAFNFTSPKLWTMLAALFVFGSFASGAYPSFVLSSFKITEVIRKNRTEGRGFTLRQGLVVFQFVASLVLIAGTFTVYRQIRHMRTEDKGLQMDQMLIVTGPNTLPWRQARQRFQLLKNEVAKLAGVDGVATSAAIPGGGHNWGADIRRSGAEVKDFKGGSVVWVDPDFIPTYKIQFLAGQNFNPAVRSDMRSVIINEASLAAYGLGTAEEALHQKLIMGEDTLAVLGVLKNYNWSSLKSEHAPYLLRADTTSVTAMSIHLTGHSMDAVMEGIEKAFKKVLPEEPYQYYFLDDFFNEQYKADQQFGKIFGLFAALAIGISCLGLWGLASFTTAQRMKEIGVRKVLGATSRSIVALLSGQFFRLVLVAAVIATPITGYLIDKWLAGFAFRIRLQWDLFLIPVVVLALIAMTTVSLQVFRGASTNPAKVLKES
jgi:putative ABC transport system permease protein